MMAVDSTRSNQLNVGQDLMGKKTNKTAVERHLPYFQVAYDSLYSISLDLSLIKSEGHWQ